MENRTGTSAGTVGAPLRAQMLYGGKNSTKILLIEKSPIVPTNRKGALFEIMKKFRKISTPRKVKRGTPGIKPTTS